MALRHGLDILEGIQDVLLFIIESDNLELIKIGVYLLK
jgi:hypothetical protein